MSKQDQ